MFRPVVFSVMLCLALPLTGCLSRTHMVRKVRRAPVVQSTTLDGLVRGINRRYDEIQTMNLTVEISATTGSGLTGEIKEYPAFSGYIFMRKPMDLRVLLLVPVLRSKALDMVSDGKTFKLLIPPRNKAIIGNNEVTTPSKNGLENLRPNVFLDSMLIHGPSEDEIVSRTQDMRVVETTDKNRDLVELPDYDLQILSKPQGQIAHTDRVLHISRDNLLTYQQEIYDATGQIVTRANYSNYQTYGAIQFPAKIVIERPLDQYSLTLIVTKATFNEKLEEDQFELKIPDTVPVQQMK